MPRVNLDEDFFSDPRIDALARSTQESKELTRGRLIGIFYYCYVKKNPYHDAETIDRYAGWVSRTHFVDHLVLTNLAHIAPNGLFRIAGVEDRIQFLLQQSEKGKRSAESRRRQLGSAKPPGRYWKNQKKLVHRNEHMFIEKDAESAGSMNSGSLPQPPALRTDVHRPMNQPPFQPVHNFEKRPVSMNRCSLPYEHIISSSNKSQVQLSEIGGMPRAGRKFSKEEIERQKAEMFARDKAGGSNGLPQGPSTAELGVGEDEA